MIDRGKARIKGQKQIHYSLKIKTIDDGERSTLSFYQEEFPNAARIAKKYLLSQVLKEKKKQNVQEVKATDKNQIKA